MIINNYIIRKLFYSNIFSLTILFSIFFIISLIGNLSENYKFSIILYLSLISSIQIFINIPILLFFIVISYFSFLMKVHNELKIIRHYLSISKIFSILIFNIVIFLLLEVYKFQIVEKIEKHKLSLINDTSTTDQLTIIKNINDTNRDYIIYHKNRNVAVKYSIVNNEFISGIYSNNAILNESVFANEYYKLEHNKISYYEKYFNFIDNIKLFSFGKINHLKNKKSLINLIQFVDILFLIFLFLFITLYILDKKFLDKNTFQINQSIMLLIIIFYSLIIINIKLNIFSNEFEILSLILLLVLTYKKVFYEKSI